MRWHFSYLVCLSVPLYISLRISCAFSCVPLCTTPCALSRVSGKFPPVFHMHSMRVSPCIWIAPSLPRKFPVRPFLRCFARSSMLSPCIRRAVHGVSNASSYTFPPAPCGLRWATHGFPPRSLLRSPCIGCGFSRKLSEKRKGTHGKCTLNT